MNTQRSPPVLLRPRDSEKTAKVGYWLREGPRRALLSCQRVFYSREEEETEEEKLQRKPEALVTALHAVARVASPGPGTKCHHCGCENESAPSDKNQGPITLVQLVEVDTENLNALGDLSLRGLRWPVPLIGTDGAWGSPWWLL